MSWRSESILWQMHGCVGALVHAQAWLVRGCDAVGMAIDMRTRRWHRGDWDKKVTGESRREGKAREEKRRDGMRGEERRRQDKTR